MLRTLLLAAMLALPGLAVSACAVHQPRTFTVLAGADDFVIGRITGYERTGGAVAEGRFTVVLPDGGAREVGYLGIQYPPPAEWTGPRDIVMAVRMVEGRAMLIDEICGSLYVFNDTPAVRAAVALAREHPDHVATFPAAAAFAGPLDWIDVPGSSPTGFAAELEAWHACHMSGEATCRLPRP